jgi:hypothetical protein
MHLTHEELSSKLVCALGDRVSNPVEFASKALASFVELTPARVDYDVGVTARYITSFDLNQGGVSTKPGNIRLNWRKLFNKVPELVLTSAGVTQPWLAPFAGWYMLNLLLPLAKVEITPAQAMTMYALWNAGRDVQRFEESEALDIANVCFQKNGAPQLSIVEFAAVVNDLVQLQCIELEDGMVRLRESVRISR